MLLTLVICTRGRTEQLRRLLESLRLQSEMSFKAIVVDQNEPGFLAPVLDDFRDLPITQVRSPLGLSRARNAGIVLADSPLIGFPDDDCWYRPSTVAEVISRFQNDPSLDVLTGRTIDADGEDSVSAHLPVSQGECFPRRQYEHVLRPAEGGAAKRGFRRNSRRWRGHRIRVRRRDRFFDPLPECWLQRPIRA
jgi:glycosyltransferase involved in cell wall biosynthesis